MRQSDETKIRTVYALELADRCYYVGQTRNFVKRFAQHIRGSGSAWTRLHPPIAVLGKVDVAGGHALILENETLLTLMEQYGWKYVRGGVYPHVESPPPTASARTLLQARLGIDFGDDAH